MALAHALRTAAVTAALAGAALLGTQAALAGEGVPAGAVSASVQEAGPVPAPTPTPTPSHINNPWD
ncbi:hypothetical protein [Streptomyces tsukubensis]|uniref:hypothetical protein n=1 Tax=Streptomyces tsukubensis TaxID=83656 RepID=UPI00344DC9FB